MKKNRRSSSSPLEAQAEALAVERDRAEVRLELARLDALLALERAVRGVELGALARHLLAQHLELLGEALAELLRLRRLLLERVELRRLELLAPRELLPGRGEVLLALDELDVLLLGLHHVRLVRRDRLLHRELPLRAPHLHLPARGVELALEEVQVHERVRVEAGAGGRHRGGHRGARACASEAKGERAARSDARRRLRAGRRRSPPEDEKRARGFQTVAVW